MNMNTSLVRIRKLIPINSVNGFKLYTYLNSIQSDNIKFFEVVHKLKLVNRKVNVKLITELKKMSSDLKVFSVNAYVKCMILHVYLDRGFELNTNIVTALKPKLDTTTIARKDVETNILKSCVTYDNASTSITITPPINVDTQSTVLLYKGCTLELKAFELYQTAGYSRSLVCVDVGCNVQTYTGTVINYILNIVYFTAVLR